MRYVRMEENRGYTRAANHGAAQASRRVRRLPEQRHRSAARVARGAPRRRAGRSRRGRGRSDAPDPRRARRRGGRGDLVRRLGAQVRGRRQPRGPGIPLPARGRLLLGRLPHDPARELFKEMGGFDEFFAPGYYEDTDLCMALRASGRPSCTSLPHAPCTSVARPSGPSSRPGCTPSRRRGVLGAQQAQIPGEVVGRVVTPLAPGHRGRHAGRPDTRPPPRAAGRRRHRSPDRSVGSVANGLDRASFARDRLRSDVLRRGR